MKISKVFQKVNFSLSELALGENVSVVGFEVFKSI
jgi:hypothetical protein